MVNYAKELRHVDLNLLPVFLTLMRERSLTKAAKVLHLGQPAVSAALKRLRNTFGDELLYRTARGMEPTWRAIELAALIEPVMGDMLRAVDVPRRFDPATEQRIFRIGMPDNHEYFLMPALLRRLQKEAPGIRLIVRAIDRSSASRLLDDGQIELACGRIGDLPRGHSREHLMDVGYLSVFDGKRMRIKAPISLEKFLALPHLLCSQNGELNGVVDMALAKKKLKREVIYASAFFSVLPTLLKQVSAVSTLPEHTARRFAEDFDLVTSPVPLRIPTYPTSLAWLAQKNEDPAHRWLRQIVKEVASYLVNTPR